MCILKSALQNMRFSVNNTPKVATAPLAANIHWADSLSVPAAAGQTLETPFVAAEVFAALADDAPVAPETATSAVFTPVFTPTPVKSATDMRGDTSETAVSASEVCVAVADDATVTPSTSTSAVVTPVVTVTPVKSAPDSRGETDHTALDAAEESVAEAYDAPAAPWADT